MTQENEKGAISESFDAYDEQGLTTDVTVTHEPTEALAPVTLRDIPEILQNACACAGWPQLMPVQSLSLPYLLARRDLMVQSCTGSGKTGTYILPLLKQLTAERRVPQALVLVPTRELAVQVEREAQALFAGSGLEVAAVYGGVGYGKQNQALRNGAQVIVGTPGRVLDHLLRRSLKLDALRTLIFDEADRMLSIGFYPDMKEVQKYLPKRKVTTCLFSATYPPNVMQLASEFMNAPAMLSLSKKQVHVPQMQHQFCLCRTMDKDRSLVRLIEMENPASGIIFCNTKANVHYVAEVLRGFGYSADELSADLSQVKREKVLGRIRDGKLRFLVATDVAARGIDIPALSHVFLYEPPADHEVYIHRAGRTGRAGAAGTVISIVDVMQKLELERIAKHYSISLVQKELPNDSDVAKVVGQRLSALLEARYRNLTGLERERVKRFRYIANIFSKYGEEGMVAPPMEDVLACEEGQDVLIAMLLDACYQESLGTPVSFVSSAKASAHADREPQGGASGKRSGKKSGERSGERFGGKSSGKPRERGDEKPKGKPEKTSFDDDFDFQKSSKRRSDKETRDAKDSGAPRSRQPQSFGRDGDKKSTRKSSGRGATSHDVPSPVGHKRRKPKKRYNGE